MSEMNTVHHKSQPRLEYILRRPRITSQKVKPFFGEEHVLSTIQPKQFISIHPPSDSLQHQQSIETYESIPTIALNSNGDINTPKTNSIPKSIVSECPLLTSPEINEAKQIEQVSHQPQRWFNRLTSKQKILLKLLVSSLVIIGLATAIGLPIYISISRQSIQQSTITITTTPSICSTITCIGKETPYRTSMISVLYPFDGNSNDLTGYATGIPYGSVTPGYTTSCYIGSSALTLSGPTTSQYIQIPYFNLAQSFTIQAWIYPASLALPDYGIFSQCDSNSRCLSISLRNGRLTVSFDSMSITNNTLIATTVLNAGDWTHLTVVYDAVLNQQQIYVMGIIDGISRNTVAPFTGTSSGSITTIGRSSSFAYGTTYFQGRIDHFTISAGTARTACQIYNDATLTAYFPFDTTATLNDYSVNLFNGITGSTVLISQGHSGQALYFPASTSYFQAACFPNLEYNDPPFSFSLWINPDTLTGGGSLIHVSNWQNGSGSNCYDYLVFSPNGALVVQWLQTPIIANATQGPIIPPNTWTHVAVVFSTTYGIRIHINGQLNAVSQGINLGINGFTSPQFITLGNNSPLGPSGLINCRNGSIPVISGPFKGAIDDFRLYNRELDNQEICVLANT